MKKFINNVDDILTESLSGFAAAHADIVSFNLKPHFLTSRQKAESKVAIISGGGSGHEPLHSVYIGYGMLDAACPGRVFTSTSPTRCLQRPKPCMPARAYCSLSRITPET